ncbi:MAG: ATP synthase F1 subunit gamma [Candidatus Coatesbacteria bacterium]|nr:ATP synthase F1 subunit gamma [Candidatus Coatesbacteria bacterium]
MATLRDVRRRILSVKSTQKLTRAMKMVGSAKLRKAERALLEARPYSDKMRSVMASVSLRAEVKDRPLLKPGGGKVEFIVITGDKGLCGAFNSNVLRFAMSSVGNLKDRQSVLYTVGKKAKDFFRRRPEFAVRGEHVGFWRTFGFSDARVVAESAVKAYTEESYDATYLIYNEFKTALAQRVVMEQLLPVAAPERPSEDTHIVDYLYEPSASVLLDELLAQHVEFQVFRALLESFASEQGARMTAMEAATDNAQDMINSLTLQYHRARQASITRELTEIVSGADALVR